eukprot:TRINITY_DN27744_c0_g2_i1.p1 TRINITY_DN27744_c0_g2~~TRINITY_DN27744_c0_g2_i1.p1  ORF type:complete len:873 (-),score=321.83 TRINITY_DN27744_c0_g2_i1:147-2765(-)
MERGYLSRVGLSVANGNHTHVMQKKGQVVGATAEGVLNGGTATGSKAKFSGAAAAFNGGACRAPCCLLGVEGFADKPVERQGRAPWLLPTKGVDRGIKAFNSITGEKEPFVPKVGNKVTWYTCGPTVYDVAHMGHARAYLTFDILRRIIKDYFKYDVLYQINITDIDDKIIMRSRQNKLFKDFSESMRPKPVQELEKVADEAVKAARKKLEAKKPEEPAATASEKDKQEFVKLQGEHQLKMSQQDELEKKVAAAKGSQEKILEAARDALMAKLDKELGHTVTDHSIFDAHSRHFENEYFEDMDNLGVLRPDIVTRISDYMDGRVQKYIEKLEDLGFCYAAKGSVYFDIDSFNKAGYNYRKLVPAANTSAAEMAEGEGALADDSAEKRNVNDFAVWKASKPGEPAWESRWGPGRPGWHIECSVMACDIHKEYLDIHGGGEDLKFPHHDNEIAQSEAYLGRPQWVNYFWHAGHLSIAGLKMSKSLKNFITIRQALQMHSARQLRLMFLMQSWDQGMNYSDQAMDMAKAEERKFKHFMGCLKFYKRFPSGTGGNGCAEREKALVDAIKECEQTVGDSLRDNFNTAKVVETISKLVTECYKSYEALPAASLEPVSKAAEAVEKLLGTLGVENLAKTVDKEADWTAALDAYANLRQKVRLLVKAKAAGSEIVAACDEAAAAVAAAKTAGLADCAASFDSFVTDLRALAQANKPSSEMLSRCDKVRNEDMVALGVRLEDKATEGFVWMFDDREVMERETKEQAEKAAAAARTKLANKLTQKKTELKVAEKAAVKPEDLFKTGANASLYKSFDDAGVPTALASGEEISAKKKKDFQKELTKQQKDYEKLEKQAGAAGIEAFLAKLRSETEELERKVGES